VADPGIDGRGRGARVGSAGRSPRYGGLEAVPPVVVQRAEPPLQGAWGLTEAEA